MLNAVSYERTTSTNLIPPPNNSRTLSKVNSPDFFYLPSNQPTNQTTGQIQNVLRKDEEKPSSNGRPFQNLLEEKNPQYTFADPAVSQTEKTQDYKNPNADDEGGDDVRVGATFHSTEVIDLDDTNDKRSGGRDHPQKVWIDSFFGSGSNSKVTINMGKKDEIIHIAEARVTTVEPLQNKKVKLSLVQADILNKVSRTIELIFPEENLERMYNNLDAKQQEGFQNALEESEKKGKLIPNSEKIPRTSKILQINMDAQKDTTLGVTPTQTNPDARRL